MAADAPRRRVAWGARTATSSRRRPPAPGATIARIALAVSPDASWTFAPGAIAVVALLSVMYVRRWRAVRGSIGRLACFAGGMALVLAALVSPIDRLAEQLFFMHMIQHLLLLDLAAILVLLGLTKVILRPATRRLVRLERAAGALAHPVFAIGCYVVVMWAWHVPALYDAALRYAGIHVLEHVSFAVAGGLYWWHLLSPIRSRKRLGGMGPVLYMVSTKVLVGLLGVGLAFAPDAIYDFYERQPGFWGVASGTDQAIGGLIMATEQSIVMGIALAYLFMRALAESDRQNEREERALDAVEEI